MAITATTLSAACGTNDTTVALTATTGVTVPNFQTGVGIIYLLIDQEFMLVVGVNTTSKIASVVRGVNGSAAVAHVNGSQVQIAATPSDFPAVTEQLVSVTTSLQTNGPENVPAVFLSGSADALTGAPGVFLVKTAGVDAITIPTPTAAMEGNVVEVWSDTTNAHTITAASACVAAGQALKTIVTFPAFAGAGVRLTARNLKWQIVGNGGVVAAGSCTLS